MIFENILREHYPQCDFTLYFLFLEKCRSTQKDSAQKHHILPRKQFPQYAKGIPENLILLSSEEHTYAHKLLEKCSSGAIKSPGAHLIGMLSEEARRSNCYKASCAAKAAVSTERRREIVSKASQTAWKRMTPEQRSARAFAAAQHRTKAGLQNSGRAGGPASTHKRWHLDRNIVNPLCKLCVSQSSVSIGRRA